MTRFRFTLTVDGDLTSDDVANALFEIDDGDSIPEGSEQHGYVHVAREADALKQAILSAARDIESTGLVVTGVENEDSVSLRNIAERTGHTHEQVRRLAHGTRGPGSFPTPATAQSENERYGWALYSWAEVSRWFDQHYGTTYATEDERDLAMADHLLKAAHLGLNVPSQEMQSLAQAWAELHGNTPRQESHQ